MSTADWTGISQRLEAAGFTVSYELIARNAECSLWCTMASRDGREWRTMAGDLAAAFLELEMQTDKCGADWRDFIKLEISRQSGKGNS